MVDDPAGSPVTAVERPNASTLRLERAFSAPLSRVWQALTDEARLAAWFWPASLLVTVTARPAPGDTFRIEGPRDRLVRLSGPPSGLPAIGR